MQMGVWRQIFLVVLKKSVVYVQIFISLLAICSLKSTSLLIQAYIIRQYYMEKEKYLRILRNYNARIIFFLKDCIERLRFRI